MASGEKNLEELKTLVVHTLETNGVLGQIRAQLRANVYKAIDNDEDRQEGTLTAGSANKLLRSAAGLLMAEIVAEFFEFYGFRHSLSVFLPESNLGGRRRSRNEVAFDAGLARVQTEVSILEQLVVMSTSTDLHKGGISSASSTTASSPPPGRASAAARPATSESFASTVDCDDFAPQALARAENAAQQEAKSIGSPRNGSSQDEAAEEVPSSARPSGDRRKKQAAACPLNSGSGSKELLPLNGERVSPPCSVASCGVSGTVPPEEVSIAESGVGMSWDSREEVREDIMRLQQLDQQIARLQRSAAAGETCTATEVATAATVPGDMAAAASNVEEEAAAARSDASAASSGASRRSANVSEDRSPRGRPLRRPQRSSPRSDGSPVTAESPARSPSRSLAGSQAASASPAGSPVSASRSLGIEAAHSPVHSGAGSDHSSGSRGKAGTLLRGGPLRDAEIDEGSFSMDESGSASLDLAVGLGGSGAVGDGEGNVGGFSSLSSALAGDRGGDGGRGGGGGGVGGRRPSPFAEEQRSVEEFDEEEDYVSEGSGSIEGYQESEAHSSGNHSF